MFDNIFTLRAIWYKLVILQIGRAYRKHFPLDYHQSKLYFAKVHSDFWDYYCLNNIQIIPPLAISHNTDQTSASCCQDKSCSVPGDQRMLQKKALRQTDLRISFYLRQTLNYIPNLRKKIKLNLFFNLLFYFCAIFLII